jgi:RNA polymerase sigma-70 factor (ECF subfamily)
MRQPAASGDNNASDLDALKGAGPGTDAPGAEHAGEAFTAEAAPHLHILYRTALRLTHHEQAAEDLVQDTLERAFGNFARYERGTNIRAWMLRIMNNAWISNYRYQARRPQAASLEAMEDFSLYRVVRQAGIAPADVEAVVLNRIGEESVLRAIDGLSADFRMVVLLADVEGFSYKDMATILDVPIGTVTSRLFRGRKQLQRSLWQYAVESGYVRVAAAPQGG